MTYIANVFDRIKNRRAKALIPFITAGYPSAAATYDFAAMAFDNGADMLELGMPFSDPIADGPAIQYSSQRALDNGCTLEYILKTTEKIRRKYKQPLILMGYYNPLHVYGMDRFLKTIADCGVNGLIIPDLPVEEGTLFREKCDAQNIATVFLVAPTTGVRRLHAIEKQSSGFVYAVSIAGITGARQSFDTKTHAYFRQLKQAMHKPFVIGFGISTPAMAADACRFADGAVIGSKFISIYRDAGSVSAGLKKSRQFLRRVRNVL